MRRAVALAFAVAACGRGAPEVASEHAGVALERAAIVRGVVADPAKIDPVGLYGNESDRVCVVRRGEGYRIGASVDFGEGQGCVASGSATGRRVLDVRFGDECRLSARVEGDRIVFPPTVSAGCDRFCSGRASLAALSGDRISASATEAASAVTAAGVRLCL